MEIPRNMLLFVAAAFCSCCSGIFLGNEAVCSGRCGFSFSAECCISVIPLSMQRWNWETKNRAFFRILWGTFLALNLYCSSSLRLQNWLCLSLKESGKKAEKYSQRCYSGGEVRALDCRCSNCICCILQLCILLLFRCHRSLGNKAHLNILFVTDERWIFLCSPSSVIKNCNYWPIWAGMVVKLHSTLKIFIVSSVFLMNSSLGFNELNLLPFNFLQHYLVMLTGVVSLHCCNFCKRDSQLRLNS